MTDLAFATHADDSDYGGERARLIPLLSDLGVVVSAHAWDDPTVDWTAFDAVVVKSTWDYTMNFDAFLAWIHATAASTRLANPVDVLCWNADKRYLLDLAAAGVAIIDTRLVEPGQPLRMPDWAEVVVKPSVSAGGRLSGRFSGDNAAGAERLLATIHSEGKAALLQPYMAGVDGAGEANVLAFGGVASHAVSKGGILATDLEAMPDTRLAEHQAISALPLDDELLAFTDLVLDRVAAAVGVERANLVHARVDSVVAGDGTRQLMEVELIEPYLYFSEAPDPSAAAAAYAQALHRWLTAEPAIGDP